MPTDATTASTVDYKADTITFDSDGFTIHVSTAASGVRPIHYFAWGGPDVSTGAVKQRMSGTQTFANSFEALSAIVMSTIATNGFGEGAVNGSSWFSWGSGHYPAYDAGNVDTWRSSTVYDQVQMSSSLGKQGFQGATVWPGGDTGLIHISEVISTIGPALTEGFRRHRPNPASLTQMVNAGGGASPWQYAAWWNGEGWTDQFTVPAAGSTTIHHPPNFTEFEAVIFSSINGAPFAGGPSGVSQRLGFGVLGENYQGCVVFGQDGSFYQATNRAVATCSASGENTAIGTLNPTSFTMESAEGGAVNQIVYHGFGGLLRQFRPHIYRRVFR